MSASFRLYQYAVVDTPSGPVQIGSLSQARSITLGDGEIISREFKVAASGIVKLFDAAEDEALADFDLLWLETDLDVLIQLTNSNDDYFVVELAGSGTAGQMGPALVLGSDLAHQSDGSVDLFDGTENVITEVWANNEDSSETARVRLVVAT